MSNLELAFKNLDRNDFLVLDTETTGLDNEALVIELSVINNYGVTLVDDLVFTLDEIPAGASNIHGIYNADTIAGVEWANLFKHLCQAVNGKNLVIYNSDYDLRLIEQTCKRYDLDYSEFKPALVICAMRQYSVYRNVIKNEYGDLKWFKLVDAAAHEGVEVKNAHRAKGDCLMTLQVIESVIEQQEVSANG